MFLHGVRRSGTPARSRRRRSILRPASRSLPGSGGARTCAANRRPTTWPTRAARRAWSPHLTTRCRRGESWPDADFADVHGGHDALPGMRGSSCYRSKLRLPRSGIADPTASPGSVAIALGGRLAVRALVLPPIVGATLSVRALAGKGEHHAADDDQQPGESCEKDHRSSQTSAPQCSPPESDCGDRSADEGEKQPAHARRRSAEASRRRRRVHEADLRVARIEEDQPRCVPSDDYQDAAERDDGNGMSQAAARRAVVQRDQRSRGPTSWCCFRPTRCTSRSPAFPISSSRPLEIYSLRRGRITSNVTVTTSHKILSVPPSCYAPERSRISWIFPGGPPGRCFRGRRCGHQRLGGSRGAGRARNRALVCGPLAAGGSPPRALRPPHRQEQSSPLHAIPAAHERARRAHLETLAPHLVRGLVVGIQRDHRRAGGRGELLRDSERV